MGSLFDKHRRSVVQRLQIEPYVFNLIQHNAESGREDRVSLGEVIDRMLILHWEASRERLQDSPTYSEA